MQWHQNLGMRMQVKLRLEPAYGPAQQCTEQEVVGCQAGGTHLPCRAGEADLSSLAG